VFTHGKSLYTAQTIVFVLLALGWIVQGLRAYRGMRSIPRLPRAAPWHGDNPPRVSIIFGARDEAAQLPAALRTMLALDYPNYEVIAVDDRSQDETPRILDDFARRDSRLKVAHVTALPSGWLGKPHALETAYQQATGDWLLFTDADIIFAPDSLSRAMGLAQREKWDHLTVLADMDMRGFWEKLAITYFGFCFVFGAQPWRVSNPKASAYMGVGAFQLLRRPVYEAIGTHRRLAFEVVDDMKLGKLVKQGGFRSGTAASLGALEVRWQEGLGNVVRGVTKNMFAALGYSASLALIVVFLLLVISVLPFAGLLFASGIARIAAGFAALVAVTVHGHMAREARISPLYGLTHPIGALIFCYMVLRSMVVTLWRGGVTWRDTFYPLAELKRGMV
jgi:Glycosyltransferase like family 2